MEKENKEIAEKQLQNETDEVEGYAYCTSSKSKCLNDCNSNTTPYISTLN